MELKINGRNLDNGLYYDGHDITNSFMWGVLVGGILTGAGLTILSYYGFWPI